MYRIVQQAKMNVTTFNSFILTKSIQCYSFAFDFNLVNKQVTLVRGLAQLFLVEMIFLNYQQTVYL
jgi:hypothetical protein